MPLVNKHPASTLLERDLPATSATSTYPLGSASDLFRVEQVELMVDANYAADASNYYVLTLQAGATVLATWSTQTGQQGAMTANAPVNMTLSATDANLVVAGGTALSLVATKNASAANITPRVAVAGRFVNPLLQNDF